MPLPIHHKRLGIGLVSNHAEVPTVIFRETGIGGTGQTDVHSEYCRMTQMLPTSTCFLRGSEEDVCFGVSVLVCFGALRTICCCWKSEAVLEMRCCLIWAKPHWRVLHYCNMLCCPFPSYMSNSHRQPHVHHEWRLQRSKASKTTALVKQRTALLQQG